MRLSLYETTFEYYIFSRAFLCTTYSVQVLHAHTHTPGSELDRSLECAEWSSIPPIWLVSIDCMVPFE